MRSLARQWHFIGKVGVPIAKKLVRCHPATAHHTVNALGGLCVRVRKSPATCQARITPHWPSHHRPYELVLELGECGALKLMCKCPLLWHGHLLRAAKRRNRTRHARLEPRVRERLVAQHDLGQLGIERLSAPLMLAGELLHQCTGCTLPRQAKLAGKLVKRVPTPSAASAVRPRTR